MPVCPSGSTAYTVRPGDTLWAIAQRFHSSPAAIAAANPGIGSMLFIGQVICVPQVPGISTVREALSRRMRLLWAQHVFWTRLVILSLVFGLPDAAPVTNRLLENPKDFAQALAPYYGAQAAARFSDLLSSHLTIAAQLVSAAKAGDDRAAAAAEKSWYANADEIAAFLSGINPNWTAEEWRSLLYNHLAMTKKEAVDYLTRNYPESVSTFDEIEKQALTMADTMTRGIAAQFPQSF